MSSTQDGIIQIFDMDNDPLYVELQKGGAFWIIPKKYKLSSVKFLSHLTEDGGCYYENLENNETSWSLPDCMSETARNNAASYQKMTREELEISLIESFPEEESLEQMAKIDSYFDPDAEKVEEDEEEEHDNENEDDIYMSTEQPPLPSTNSSPKVERQSNNAYDSSDDEDNAMNALAHINQKAFTHERTESEGEHSDGKVVPVYDRRASTTATVSLKTIEQLQATTIKVSLFLIIRTFFIII